MGQTHPTLVLSFTSPLPHNDIAQQIAKAVRSDSRYQIIGRTAGTDTQSSMELIFTTPTCGWLDRVRLVITTEANQTIINATSNCTNVCCGWCGPMRSLCDCFKLYSDNGQNAAHIRELMKKVGAKDEKLITSTGLVIYKEEGIKSRLI